MLELQATQAQAAIFQNISVIVTIFIKNGIALPSVPPSNVTFSSRVEIASKGNKAPAAKSPIKVVAIVFLMPCFRIYCYAFA